MRQKPEAICTVALIVINIAVFFILTMFGDTEDAVFMLQHGAMYEPNIIEGHEYYRIFTCLFLHFGITHLLNNMVLLGALGWNSVRRSVRSDLRTYGRTPVCSDSKQRKTRTPVRTGDAGHGRSQPLLRADKHRGRQSRAYRRSCLRISAGSPVVQEKAVLETGKIRNIKESDRECDSKDSPRFRRGFCLDRSSMSFCYTFC